MHVDGVALGEAYQIALQLIPASLILQADVLADDGSASTLSATVDNRIDMDMDWKRYRLRRSA